MVNQTYRSLGIVVRYTCAFFGECWYKQCRRDCFYSFGPVNVNVDYAGVTVNGYDSKKFTNIDRLSPFACPPPDGPDHINTSMGIPNTPAFKGIGGTPVRHVVTFSQPVDCFDWRA